MADPSDAEKQRYIDSFLAFDLDVEFVRLAKIDVLRRLTLDERYRTAQAWIDQWSGSLRGMADKMHRHLDAITPLPRDDPGELAEDRPPPAGWWGYQDEDESGWKDRTADE